MASNVGLPLMCPFHCETSLSVSNTVRQICQCATLCDKFDKCTVSFPETICDNGKYVKYLLTILRQLFFTCCRDIVVNWCELLICPIEYH